MQPLKFRIKQTIDLSRPAVTPVVAEVLLYGALVYELRDVATERDAMLARLKGALAAGFQRGSWDLNPMFDAVLPRLPDARQSFYRSLGDALLDPDRVAALDLLPEWRALQVRDPLAPDAG